MLHSGHPEAKSLIDNGLRVRKAHNLVVSGNAISTILWLSKVSRLSRFLIPRKSSQVFGSLESDFKGSVEEASFDMGRY